MSDVVCRIVLSEGTWKRQPSEQALRGVLQSVFPSHADAWVLRPPTLVRLEFEEPSEGEILVAEAVVRTRYCHAEIIRDDIIEAMLACFQPEYESMVEVEVLE